MDETLARRVHGIATLDHPLTSEVYALLGERGEVSRDDAAAALDVARSVAAFHLDKLVEAGLAQVRFQRLSGRTGPGAGRTAKVYRRSEEELEVSLPERHYDLAGQLLAEAVERSTTEKVPVDQALRAAAAQAGRALGEAAKQNAGPRPTKTKRRDALLKVLERNGYEPNVQKGEILLANCPFHSLAQKHRDVVCGMNLELMSGILDGAGDDHFTARLAPEPGFCCVRMRSR